MKHLRAAAAFCLACVACAGLALAVTRRTPQGRVSVRAKGRRAVVVTEGRRSHTLDLLKHVDAARIEEVSAPFLTRRGAFVYLLLDVCGLSKVPPDDRQCGAGTECNVVWLKLDAGWRVRDAKSERYESCWAPVTSDEGPKVAGRRMTLAVEDLREEVRREVTYDADDPEAGLKVTRSPLPKTTP
ncbi:MAG TPA: hypothetical protein VF736_16470 [Pyrinomonadaceae bacterium]